MNLRRLLFYLTLFTAPLFTVSPWQEILGIPVGAIYAVLAGTMILVSYKEIIGAFRSTGLNSISLYPFLFYMAAGLLSLAILLLSGRVETESYITAGYMVFSIAVCWAFAVIPEDYDMLMEGIAVYLAGAVLACLYGFYYTVGFMAGLDTDVYLTWTVPRLFGTGTEPQVFGNFIISVLPAAIAFYLFKVRKMSGIAMIPVLWVLGLALIMTFAAGSWAGLGVGLLLLLPNVGKLDKTKIGGCIVVVALISVSIFGVDRFIYPGYLAGFPSIMQKFTGKELLVSSVDDKQNKKQNKSEVKSQAKPSPKQEKPSAAPAPAEEEVPAHLKIQTEIGEIVNAQETVSSAEKNNLNTRQSYTLNMWSLNEREWLRAAAWNMFKAHPLTGVGVGKFGSFYHDYKPAGASDMPYVKVKAHNQYMEILAETGIIGFIAFLTMFGYCIFIVLYAFVNNFDSSVKFTILGLFASLVAMSVQGYSFGVFYHNYYWIIMGLTYAAFRVSVGNNTRRLFGL